MTVSRDENFIASSHCEEIKLLDSKTFQPIKTFEDAHCLSVCSIKFTSDDRYLISSSLDNTIKIWDIRQQKLLQTIEHEKLKIGTKDSRFCISPNDQYIICGTKEGGIFYYDTKANNLEDYKIGFHKTEVLFCEWQPKSSNHPIMVSADRFGIMNKWSI